MSAFTTGQLGSASVAHSASAVMRATEASHGQCIHELFEEQVQRTPHSPAVVFEDYQLTYSELNRRANGLAHYLRSQGVRPEVLVAICLERSLEIPIAIMAILKAGGAYVPLDPDFPRARLAFTLDDVKAPILLTVDRLVARLPEHSGQVVCLDTNWSLIEASGQENPRIQLFPVTWRT